MLSAARVALGIAVMVAAGALAACSGAHNDQTNLAPASASPIADVPVPTSFSMTGESTSKVEASGVRSVDHKYSGSDDVLPVVRFYKDQMPAKGWTFADQSQLIHNQISLHYTKGSEECVVTVTPGSFHTHIRVQIDPIGHNATK